MALDRKALAKTLGGGFTVATTFPAADMTKVDGQDFTQLAQDKTTKQNYQLPQDIGSEDL